MIFPQFHSYPPTLDAVMSWLEDSSSFILNGDTEESILSNDTLIRMCHKIQKYETDTDSSEKYMQQLSSVIRELEMGENSLGPNGLKRRPNADLKETANVASDGTSWDTGIDSKYRKFCEEEAITYKSIGKGYEFFQNKLYPEAILEFESAAKVCTHEPDLSMIKYAIYRACYLTDTYDNLLKGLLLLADDQLYNGEPYKGICSEKPEKRVEDLVMHPIMINYAVAQLFCRFKKYDNAMKMLQSADSVQKMSTDRKISDKTYRDETTKVCKKLRALFPETYPNDAAQKKIDEMMDVLKNPPKPDFTCFHPDCNTFNQHEFIEPQKEIYYNKDIKDLDFKGMSILKCENKCVIAYHATCWKEHKKKMEKIKYDKDFLGKRCITPDCGGKVIELRLVRENGKESIVKVEEEVKKCEELKKVKSKVVPPVVVSSDTGDGERLAKKNVVKEKHTTEGKSNKKDKRGNDGKMRERHISGHSTPGATDDPGDSAHCKDEDLENLDGKDRLIKKLMDELALARKKAELQERTIERNHGEMHDVLVRSDETKNHVKRQAEVGFKL